MMRRATRESSFAALTLLSRLSEDEDGNDEGILGEISLPIDVMNQPKKFG